MYANTNYRQQQQLLFFLQQKLTKWPKSLVLSYPLKSTNVIKAGLEKHLFYLMCLLKKKDIYVYIQHLPTH